MKTSQVAILLILLAVLASLVSTSSALAWGNVLRNPGFEEDGDSNGIPDHWHTSKGGLSSTDIADLVRDGSQAAEFTATEDQTSMWQVVQVQPGGAYIFSGHVIKNDNRIGSVFLRIRWYEGEDGVGQEIYQINSLLPLTGNDANYRPISVAGTAPITPKSAHYARVEAVLTLVSTPSGPATAYFDDMSFTGPPPSTPTSTPSPSPTPTPSPSPSPAPTPTPSLTPTLPPASTEIPVETQTPTIPPIETPTVSPPGGATTESSGDSGFSGIALRGVGIALAVVIFGVLFWVARRRGSGK